jgi:hypothetical protein
MVPVFAPVGSCANSEVGMKLDSININRNTAENNLLLFEWIKFFMR